MHKHLVLLGIAIVVCVAGSAVVSAFPFNKSWHEKSTGIATGGMNRAGGQGRYGTGGRTDRGIKCSHCHIKGPGLITMSLTPVPAFTKKNGDDAYTPGTRYTITVQLTNEQKSAGLMNNKNLFALAIENASGQRAGRYITDSGQDSQTCSLANPFATSPAGKTTFVYGDCHAVLALDFPRLTQWTFDWVAPAAGAGDLTMFVGMVDGNSDGESSLDDDTLERAIPLRQGP